MRRRQKILPNASIQRPEKDLNHWAKMNMLPSSSQQTVPLKEQDHQSKSLMMPCLNQSQAKIKVLPSSGHKNTPTPLSCFKHQAPAIQLSHIENQTMAVPLPHLDHQSPVKPLATQLSCPKHWARSTIPSLPFPDSMSRTTGSVTLPWSENWITPPLSPDLWNRAPMDPEHLPRIPQGFDHWAENVRHLNDWSTISSSPHYQNEATSCIDGRQRVKTINSLTFDYWMKAIANPLPSHSHQSKASQVQKYYERDIISPLPLQTFSYQHRPKGTPLLCSNPKVSCEPSQNNKTNPLTDSDQMINKDKVKGRLNFNQWIKAPDPKHLASYPLGAKDPETETNLVPDYQVSLLPDPVHGTKALPNSDLTGTKILSDPEYQAEFPLGSQNCTKVSLDPIYENCYEPEPDQKTKCLLVPKHHAKFSLDTDQHQVEAKIGPTLQVYFDSGLNHKIKFIQGTNECIENEPKPKQQDEISLSSEIQISATLDPDQRIKLPSNSTNWTTFPLSTKHRDTLSQNPNNHIVPHSDFNQQSIPLLGSKQVTSPALKKWIKSSQAPKYWTTPFPWPKHPKISQLSFEHGQINQLTPGRYLDSPRDCIPSAQGHSYPDYCSKVLIHSDKQIKALSDPRYRSQAIKNRELSWYSNYIRPYIVEGGNVQKRTVNHIISSIPQEEIKNDIRKKILLKWMKECAHFQNGPRLYSSFNVCVLCASWIPHGCPHVDKIHRQTVAQLLAIPTPMPGSNSRMGIQFVLQLPRQRTFPDIYFPFQNFGVPDHIKFSPVFPLPSHSEPKPLENLLFSWLDYSHNKKHQSSGRKTGNSELFSGKMSKTKEVSVESKGIFKSFLEKYQMKRKEN